MPVFPQVLLDSRPQDSGPLPVDDKYFIQSRQYEKPLRLNFLYNNVQRYIQSAVAQMGSCRLTQRPVCRIAEFVVVDRPEVNSGKVIGNLRPFDLDEIAELRNLGIPGKNRVVVISHQDFI